MITSVTSTSSLVLTDSKTRTFHIKDYPFNIYILINI